MTDSDQSVRHVKIKEASNGEFYFVVTAANNEPVYNSETYADLYGAVEAAVREHRNRGGGDFSYVLEYSHDGQAVKVALNQP